MSFQTAGPLKVRVGVVVLDDQRRLLLLRQNNRPFWVLPGGTLEPGESLAQCAIRELKEETNLDIAIGPLISLGDFLPDDGRHVIDVVFMGTLLGGNFVMETTENINEAGFFSQQQMHQMELKPPAVFSKIAEYWQTGFPQGDSVYQGAYIS